MHNAIEVDLGPDFYGWRGSIRAEIVCVVTPRVATDASARRVVRELVRRHGGDCGTCQGCPVGGSMTQ